MHPQYTTAEAMWRSYIRGYFKYLPKVKPSQVKYLGKVKLLHFIMHASDLDDPNKAVGPREAKHVRHDLGLGPIPPQ